MNTHYFAAIAIAAVATAACGTETNADATDVRADAIALETYEAFSHAAGQFETASGEVVSFEITHGDDFQDIVVRSDAGELFRQQLSNDGAVITQHADCHDRRVLCYLDAIDAVKALGAAEPGVYEEMNVANIEMGLQDIERARR